MASWSSSVRQIRAFAATTADFVAGNAPARPNTKVGWLRLETLGRHLEARPVQDVGARSIVPGRRGPRLRRGRIDVPTSRLRRSVALGASAVVDPRMMPPGCEERIAILAIGISSVGRADEQRRDRDDHCEPQDLPASTGGERTRFLFHSGLSKQCRQAGPPKRP